MPLFALPPDLMVLEAPLLDDLASLPNLARDPLHQRLVDNPRLAQRMAQALFETVMELRALVAANEAIVHVLLVRMAQRRHDDGPDVLALRQRQIQRVQQRVGTRDASEGLWSGMAPHERRQFEQRLARLHAVLERV